jgi:hypothetical protein
VDLEVFDEAGKWGVRLKDPLNQKTVNNTDRHSTIEAAKNTALSVADGYLTNEYS